MYSTYLWIDTTPFSLSGASVTSNEYAANSSKAQNWKKMLDTDHIIHSLIRKANNPTLVSAQKKNKAPKFLKLL